jgi:hypothetical protein
VAKAVQRCGCQERVGGECLVPLGEVQIAGDDGGGALIALGNEFMQVFVCRRTQRLEPEVVNDQDWNATQGLQLAGPKGCWPA